MDETGSALRSVAGFMALAARTAPKTRGKDNLVIKVFEKDELPDLASRMKEAGKKTERYETFRRDSENILASECVLVIGTTSVPLGLDCGFCGEPTCRQASDKDITCAYNSGDLGIAAGSAAASAADHRADNRIMYTVGYTVKEFNLLDKPVRMALGIPVSGTGKNIYFDRK